MPAKDKYKFHITVEVDQQFIRDVLVTAVEGGVNYWCQIRSYSPDNLYADITESPDLDGGANWKIGHSTIERGIKRVLSGNMRVAKTYVNYLLEAVTGNDAGHVDSEVADMIVQAGLFNEVRYG